MVQGMSNQFGDLQDELDPDDIIGIIKIKEGLFIADQIGSQVTKHFPATFFSNEFKSRSKPLNCEFYPHFIWISLANFTL